MYYFFIIYAKKYNSQILNYNNIKNHRKYFFLEKSKLNNCKNYGILIYNYPHDKIRHKFGNIGDYIQSLAALQFLPRNCLPFFIDRDNIEFYNGPKAIIIMNGWYNIFKGNRQITKNLSPIYISLHIKNAEKLDNKTINNLKKFEPIGCRDTFTLKYLKYNKINAYFSSCLTTTLDIDYFTNNSERSNEIIFIDYKFGYDIKIDKFIKSLKAYNFTKVSFITHIFQMNLSQFERFKRAKLLLDKYSKAKLVITTRIHGALPCLALKTPVIFVNKRFDRRYYGLYELLNTVGINSKGKFMINVKFNNDNFVINPKKYLKYSNDLKKILKNKLNHEK